MKIMVVNIKKIGVGTKSSSDSLEMHSSILQSTLMYLYMHVNIRLCHEEKKVIQKTPVIPLSSSPPRLIRLGYTVRFHLLIWSLNYFVIDCTFDDTITERLCEQCCR